MQVETSREIASARQIGEARAQLIMEIVVAWLGLAWLGLAEEIAREQTTNQSARVASA